MLSNRHIIHSTKYWYTEVTDIEMYVVRIITKLVPTYVLKIPFFSKEPIIPINLFQTFPPSTFIEAEIIIAIQSRPELDLMHEGLKRNLLNTYQSGLLYNINIGANYDSNVKIYKEDYSNIERYKQEHLILILFLSFLIAADLYKKYESRDDEFVILNILNLSIYKSLLLLPFIYTIIPTNPTILKQQNQEFYDNIIMFYSFADGYEDIDNDTSVSIRKSYTAPLDLTINEPLLDSEILGNSIILNFFSNYPYIDNYFDYLDIMYTYLIEKLEEMFGNLLTLQNRYKTLFLSIVDSFKNTLLLFKNNFINKFNYNNMLEAVNKKIKLLRESLENISKNITVNYEIEEDVEKMIKLTNLILSKPISLLFQNSALLDRNINEVIPKSTISVKDFILNAITKLLLYFSTVIQGHEVRINHLTKINKQFFGGQQIFLKDSILSQALLALFISNNEKFKIKFGYSGKFLTKLMNVFLFDAIFYNQFVLYSLINEKEDPIILAVKDYLDKRIVTKDFVLNKFKNLLPYIE